MHRFEPHRPRTSIALAAALALAAGCSKGPEKLAPVEPEKAREALKTALETWKNGKRPDDLKAATPPITVQDPDWVARSKLIDYQLTGEGKDFGAILTVPVKIKVRGPNGKDVEKDATYRVGTSPTLSIFRDSL